MVQRPHKATKLYHCVHELDEQDLDGSDDSLSAKSYLKKPLMTFTNGQNPHKPDIRKTEKHM